MHIAFTVSDSEKDYVKPSAGNHLFNKIFIMIIIPGDRIMHYFYFLHVFQNSSIFLQQINASAIRKIVSDVFLLKFFLKAFLNFIVIISLIKYILKIHLSQHLKVFFDYLNYCC